MRRGWPGRLLRPLVAVVAALYFLLDALVLPALRPLVRALGRLRLWQAVEAWTVRLPAYPALFVILAPLALLEPAKPVAAWLLHEGHAGTALTVLALAEVLKLTVVERLFRANRDKLLSIDWFARLYRAVTGAIALLTRQPLWQAAARRVKAWARWLRRLFRPPRENGPVKPARKP